jgi:AraC-type transcriptional regulator N-terminus
VIIGDEVYQYDASRMIVFSVALPVAAQVTRASQSEPYLSLRFDLDPHKIAELVLKVFPRGLPPVQERSAVYLTAADPGIVNAATRLMECLRNPGDSELLASLAVDEILIRLLRSPIGVRVAQMGFAESSVHRVAKAISWLRAHEGRRSGRDGAHECFFFPRALQVSYFDEPAALSKGTAPCRRRDV